MMRYLTRILSAFAVLMACLWSLAASAGTWISAAELAELSDLVIVDARGAKEYAEGHLPGAVNAPWQTLSDMSGKPGEPGWGEALPPEKLAAAIGRLGISNGSRVVVYSASPSGWGEDGRVAWTLRLAGLQDVSILDGGIEAWRQSGGEITTRITKPEPADFILHSLDESLTADKQAVKAAIGSARIVDSRMPEEYAGAQKYGEARGGHLPGAVNIPWTQVFGENGRIRDAAELVRHMREAGISPGDDIIAYCTAGIRSAHLVMALREAGFSRARNYDASFHEWAGDPSLPLE